MQMVHESGVYIIDNFLSDEECATFMKQISDKKKTYKRNPVSAILKMINT